MKMDHQHSHAAILAFVRVAAASVRADLGSAGADGVYLAADHSSDLDRAIPAAVYVATHQYSFLDYLISFISFIGWHAGLFDRAVYIWYMLAIYNVNVAGLFSQQFIDAPWSLAKFQI